jgi:microcystin-dependent protein
MNAIRTAAASTLALALSAAAAPVAWPLPFQGVATDSTGRPKPDGSASVAFQLFDAASGGNSVWSETDTVSLKKGLFSLQLGTKQVLPLNLLGRKDLWLQVAFGGESPVSPRIAMGRNVEAWYAHAASTADHATSADTASYVKVADSSRAARRSDTALYAAKSAFGLAVQAPLALSASNDTLKLKPGTASGNFLTWDGTNWVAKTTTYTTSIAGGSQPLPIRNPYLGVNFIIALQGIFPSRSGDSPFVGEIEIVGFNFAPTGWALCNGQLLAISQNTALFSLLGTMYGGNGTTTFQLPNLQSRTPVHFGQGSGLSAVSIGEMGGTESVTITTSQMPMHTHVVTASP